MHNRSNINPTEYTEILQQAVAEIRVARNLVAKQLTSAANSVYWSLGKLLFEKQLEEGYGSGVVKQLSVDLKSEFPDMGLSSRNLWDMKRFYERYHMSDPKLRQAVAVLRLPGNTVHKSVSYNNRLCPQGKTATRCSSFGSA